jgi:hypothetical protein
LQISSTHLIEAIPTQKRVITDTTDLGYTYPGSLCSATINTIAIGIIITTRVLFKIAIFMSNRVFAGTTDLGYTYPSSLCSVTINAIAIGIIITARVLFTIVSAIL